MKHVYTHILHIYVYMYRMYTKYFVLYRIVYSTAQDRHCWNAFWRDRSSKVFPSGSLAPSKKVPLLARQSCMAEACLHGQPEGAIECAVPQVGTQYCR